MTPVGFGDDICFYLQPGEQCVPLSYQAEIAPGAADLERTLAAKRVRILYADPVLPPALRWRG